MCFRPGCYCEFSNFAKVRFQLWPPGHIVIMPGNDLHLTRDRDTWPLDTAAALMGNWSKYILLSHNNHIFADTGPPLLTQPVMELFKMKVVSKNSTKIYFNTKSFEGLHISNCTKTNGPQLKSHLHKSLTKWRKARFWGDGRGFPTAMIRIL